MSSRVQLELTLDVEVDCYFSTAGSWEVADVTEVYVNGKDVIKETLGAVLMQDDKLRQSLAELLEQQER